MEIYKLEFSKQASQILKWMAGREPGIYRRVSNALDSLEQDPHQGKSLKGALKGRYSYRVADYRIIYKIEKSILKVYVIDIGHRRDIYR